MAFEGLTNKGREYMAKCLAENKPITFVKVKIGNGSLEDNENPETFTDIKSLKKEVDICEKTQIEDAVRLLIQIDNKGIKEGYFPREIGIYVQDGGQELLYWYINDGTEASWLPSEDRSPVKFKYFINLMATNLDTVIVNWTGTELWVDREFLGKEMAKKVDKTTSITGTGALQGGGALSENRQITHKDEKGYKHIPLGGATKQFLKWASDGIAKWGALLWEDIEGKPSALKNPQSLKIKTNGTLKGEYIGDTAKEINITSADTGGLMKGNLPAIIKDEKTMLDIMENQGGLNFDTSLLYLNDAGTKQVGKLYLDKNKKGLFECIKQTTGTVNSTEYFVEYSIKANNDRLANLISFVSNDTSQGIIFNNLKIMCGTIPAIADGGKIYFPKSFNNPPTVLVNTDMAIGYGSNITTCIHQIFKDYFIVAHNYGRPQNIFWIAVGE